MDKRRFDELSRRVAEGASRRSVVKGAAAALLAALGIGAADAAAQVTQATCGNQTCINNPCACTPGCVCCVYSNGNSRCRPPGQCSPGTESVCAPPTTTTTTSTTTTTPPPQNNCPAGANTCTSSGTIRCNDGCGCYQAPGGGAVCGDIGICTDCNSDADCEQGYACIVVGDSCQDCVHTNGRFCIRLCPIPD